MKRDDKLKNEIVTYVRTQYKSQADVCQKFGIGRTTLARWRREDDLFRVEMDEAVRDMMTRELPSKAIEGLSMLVKGYESRTERSLYVRGADGKEKLISRTVTKTQMPPDVRAIVFVLANMRPDEFEK